MKNYLQILLFLTLCLINLLVPSVAHAQPPAPPVLPFQFQPYDIPTGGNLTMLDSIASAEFLTTLVNVGLTVFKIIMDNPLMSIVAVVICFAIFIRFVYNFIIAKDDGIELEVRAGITAAEEIAAIKGVNLRGNSTYQGAKSTFQGKRGVYAGGRRIF